MLSGLPARPWQKVRRRSVQVQETVLLGSVTLLFEVLRVLHLPVTTTCEVIEKLKATFARYGKCW